MFRAISLPRNVHKAFNKNLRLINSRAIYNVNSSIKTRVLDLAFTEFLPQNGNATRKALIILHGLFGSKRNWHSLCNAFRRDLPEYAIYALDLRNHGASPHAAPMDYEVMAEDVLHFIAKMQLHDVALMGHSLGGKVAMTAALSLSGQPTHSSPLSHLIVSDIAPTPSALSPDFVRYIHIMQEINELPFGSVRTRNEVNEALKVHIPDNSIRQFLLTNLVIPENEKPVFSLPLPLIASSVPSLSSFPYDQNDESNTRWKGKTLVFKGAKSSYITAVNLPSFEKFFPNYLVEVLDTGHWVHAEKPNEYREIVTRFLTSD